MSSVNVLRRINGRASFCNSSGTNAFTLERFPRGLSAPPFCSRVSEICVSNAMFCSKVGGWGSRGDDMISDEEPGIKPVDAPRIRPCVTRGPRPESTTEPFDLADTIEKDGEVVRDADETETPLAASGSASASSMLSWATVGEDSLGWASRGSRRRNFCVLCVLMRLT